MQHRTVALLLLLLAAFPAAAQPNARADSPAVLRAGPAPGYPILLSIGRGDELQVHGCLTELAFCDVSVQQQRGWLPTALIAFDHDIGVSAVAFDLDTYWDAHYRDRPWSRQRARWRGLTWTERTVSSASVPAPLRQQLPSPTALPRAADAATATPTASSDDPAQWISPGERMYRQRPPPDALNPKRNRKMFRELYGSGETPPRTWWPPDPEQLEWLRRHSRP